MAKYLVTSLVTISMSIVVEADSEMEAREKAEDCHIMSLCHFCSRGSNYIKDEWRTSGEIDGIPEIHSVEKL